MATGWYRRPGVPTYYSCLSTRARPPHRIALRCVALLCPSVLCASLTLPFSFQEKLRGAARSLALRVAAEFTPALLLALPLCGVSLLSTCHSAIRAAMQRVTASLGEHTVRVQVQLSDIHVGPTVGRSSVRADGVAAHTPHVASAVLRGRACAVPRGTAQSLLRSAH